MTTAGLLVFQAFKDRIGADPERDLTPKMDEDGRVLGADYTLGSVSVLA